MAMKILKDFPADWGVGQQQQRNRTSHDPSINFLPFYPSNNRIVRQSFFLFNLPGYSFNGCFQIIAAIEMTQEKRHERKDTRKKTREKRKLTTMIV
jgi:hypothetical protein